MILSISCLLLTCLLFVPSAISTIPLLSIPLYHSTYYYYYSSTIIRTSMKLEVVMKQYEITNPSIKSKLMNFRNGRIVKVIGTRGSRFNGRSWTTAIPYRSGHI